jgi:signal transduction histidine kinase
LNQSVPGQGSAAEALALGVRKEHALLVAELSEIDLLVQQARAEASRHESKRAAAADRFAAAGQTGSPAEIAEQSKQLVTLTRRAVVMQTQVDVLEGKLKVLQRFRDAVARTAEDLEALASGSGGASVPALGPGSGRPPGRGKAASGGEADNTAGSLPLADSRMVLAAQEDLRREIARTMHDGPAQSLTNIVLQAQIVERLVGKDPAMAAGEVRQLISMVQQTLDATKSFIFDVRPMVLDDLGLVPTIRRAARERSRRAQIPVELESYGTPRRLTMELESGLFRILDETLAAQLAGRPERVSIRLDWTEGLEARIAAHRPVPATPQAAVPSRAAAADDAAHADIARARSRGKGSGQAPETMPEALAAMIEDRRLADNAARRAAWAIPASIRREIQQRAASLDVTLELVDDGREVRLLIEAPGARE